MRHRTWRTRLCMPYWICSELFLLWRGLLSACAAGCLASTSRTILLSTLMLWIETLLSLWCRISGMPNLTLKWRSKDLLWIWGIKALGSSRDPLRDRASLSIMGNFCIARNLAVLRKEGWYRSRQYWSFLKCWFLCRFSGVALLRWPSRSRPWRRRRQERRWRWGWRWERVYFWRFDGFWSSVVRWEFTDNLAYCWAVLVVRAFKLFLLI